MKGYWINRCHVTDSKGYGEYAKLAGPAIEKFGGRFLVRAGDQVELEGGPYERTVLVEFDSMEDAQKAYNSDEYAQALEHSKDSSERLVVIVEGLS
jgi:uncharacterized protein (DUF1330 family)|tara:strand:- start:318 stop:605 length:288 start_codon:yes stop_codon:yes gene_type:complete